MMDNFDSLRKDFEQMRNNCGTGCVTDEEEVEFEDEDGFIGTVQNYMLTPQKVGVYFSRLDIKAIGLMFDEDVQVRERKRMLRDILKAVNSKEKMIKIFDIIKEATDAKIEQYDELIESFPKSEELFTDKKQKANNFKKILDKILDDVDEEAEFI